MNDFWNATHPSNSTFCPEVTPFWAAVTDGQTYNLTVPGSPPFGVHSRYQDRGWGISLHLPGDLTTNTFSWTPVVQDGAADRPQTEGNETDFRALTEAGDSLIWVFTERTEIDPNVETPENRVWISGNFTVRTQEMVDNGELENLEDEQAENGSLLGKRTSLKTIALAGMLVFALSGLTV